MFNHSEDVHEAGMNAWNTLTVLIDKDDSIYTDVQDFASFYDVVIAKLLEEEVSD